MDTPKQMTAFEKVEEQVALLKHDAAKFYENGNNAAGTRLRIGMQALKGLAQDVRNEVTAKKNA